MSQLFIVRKVPTQTQALTNKVWINPAYANWNIIVNDKNFEVGYDNSIPEGYIGINAPGRQELNINLGETVMVEFPIQVLHTSVAPLDQEVDTLGVTVRRGKKWFNYADERSPGALIDLCQCNETHTIIGRGRVENFDSCEFRHIPARIVEQEHCADARTYTGLLNAMRQAYPGFRETEEITWILYRRIA